jgi:hypothetical protein
MMNTITSTAMKAPTIIDVIFKALILSPPMNDLMIRLEDLEVSYLYAHKASAIKGIF